jgi:hypothetical protein
MNIPFSIIIALILIAIYIWPEYTVIILTSGALAVLACHSTNEYYGVYEYYGGKPLIPPKQIIQQIKLASRALFSVLRGSSLTAISASLETVGSGFPLDTLSDIVGVCLEAFITFATITSKVADIGVSIVSSEIKDLLYSNDFSEGPSGIYQTVKPLLEKYKQDSSSKDLLDKLCGAYSEILIEAGSFLAQLISAFIPDDFGAAQLVIRTGITAGIAITQMAAEVITRNPFEIIVAIYKLAVGTPLPLGLNVLMKNFLQDKEYRKQYLKNLFMFIRTLLQERIDFTYWQRFKYSFANQAIFFGLYGLAALTLFLPGWIFLFGVTEFTVLNAHIITTLLNLGVGNKQLIYLLDTYILPDEQIQKMSEAIEYILTQAFIGALVMSECKNLDTKSPDQIDAAGVVPDVNNAITNSGAAYDETVNKKRLMLATSVPQ